MNHLRPRVIPCLQLQHRDMVKTRRFKDPQYLGDPINAVKIFNDLECDELIVVDITATREGRSPDMAFIEEFAAEAFMPLAYGGGITQIDEIRKLFSLGIEKVVLNTAAHSTTLVRDAATIFGSQSIVVSMDVRKSLWGRYEVWTHDATTNTKMDPFDYAREMVGRGAGELFVQSIELEGTLSGYDIELMRRLAGEIHVPVIACGGAANLIHMKQMLNSGVAAVAAGTMFVLHGKHRAPLISYPKPHEIESLSSAD